MYCTFIDKMKQKYNSCCNNETVHSVIPKFYHNCGLPGFCSRDLISGTPRCSSWKWFIFSHAVRIVCRLYCGVALLDYHLFYKEHSSFGGRQKENRSSFMGKMWLSEMDITLPELDSINHRVTSLIFNLLGKYQTWGLLLHNIALLLITPLLRIQNITCYSTTTVEKVKQGTELLCYFITWMCKCNLGNGNCIK